MSDEKPTIRIRNTGDGVVRIYQIVNTETGEGVDFNLEIRTGEEVTLVTGD